MPAVAAAASWLGGVSSSDAGDQETVHEVGNGRHGWRGGRGRLDTICRLTIDNRPQGSPLTRKQAYKGLHPVLPTEQERLLEERLGPLAVKLGEIEDEHGLDMRRLSGDEAMAFMAAQGIHIGGRQLG